MKKILSIATAAMVAMSAFAVVPAKAQDYSRMGCYDLWYARNAIYAAKGYCFKTERARSVFGRACFPPYGQLTANEHRRVALIQQWEARRGCN